MEEAAPEESIFRLFIGYIMFAGIATAVDVGLLYFLTEYLDVWYFFSALIAYLAGMVVNYSTNKYLNFKNQNRRIFTQFSIFATVALIGLALNQIIIYSLVEYADIWYMLAKAIALVTVVFWSFYGHRRFSFGVLK